MAVTGKEGNPYVQNFGRAGAKMVRQAADRIPPTFKKAISQMMTDAMLRAPKPLSQELVAIAQDPENLLQSRLEQLRNPDVRAKLPKTVVIIPDGNRRYGQENGLTIEQAHDLGARVLYESLKVFEEFNEIENIILWGWSTDNETGRPKSQKLTVLNTMATYLDLFTPELDEKNCKLIHVGRTDRLEPDLSSFAESMRRSQELTKNNTGTKIYLGVDYGEDYEDALFAHGLTGDVDLSTLTPEKAAEIRRYVMGIPDPDLVVRTSGEMRLSGFPYGSHAEQVFIKTKLPALMPHEIAGALLAYAGRDVRKGK